MKFLISKLSGLGTRRVMQTAIVRCQIVEKNQKHCGRAVLLLESMQCYNLLQSMMPLKFEKRELWLKLGNGSSSSKRTKNYSVYPFDNVDISLGLSVAAAKQESFVSLWQCTDQSMVLHGDRRRLVLQFGSYKAEISLKRIRKVLLGRVCHSVEQCDSTNAKTGTDGRICISVTVDRPPCVYREIKGLFSILAGATSNPFLWEQDDSGLDIDDSKWMRTIDPTKSNAFARCTIYRITLSQSTELHYAIDVFNKFALLRYEDRNKLSIHMFPIAVCNNTEYFKDHITSDEDGGSSLRSIESLVSRVLQDPVQNHLRCIAQHRDMDTSNWDALCHGQLSFTNLHYLHCLIGCNKLDFYHLTADTELDNTTAKDSSAGNKSGFLLLKDFVQKNGEGFLNVIMRRWILDSKIKYISNLSVALSTAVEDLSDYSDDDVDRDDLKVLWKDNRAIGDLTEKLADFKLASDSNVSKTEVNTSSMSYCWISRVLVTPLRICPQLPELEQSNRVLRQFFQHLDRFVRVTFVDENFGSILQEQSDDIFKLRIATILHNGLVVGGRRYVFLAFSNSQLREQSCWFYCEEAGKRMNGPSAKIKIGDFPTAQAIRDWIGNLSSIKIIAKYAARLGQGFSTTVPTTTVADSDFEEIPDVFRNGFCFSDGVGMISVSAAKTIKTILKLEKLPPAFQIRFGGGKGMVTVMPDEFMKHKSILVRPSMMKFLSTSKEIGVNGIAKVIPAYLNRQLITLLSTRGITDQVFKGLYTRMTKNLDAALHDPSAAQVLLENFCDVGVHTTTVNPMTSAWCMLEYGVSVEEDMFLQGIIRAVRRKLLIDIQTRCRLFLPNACCLYGVMDETKTLQQGEIFVQLSSKKYPNLIQSGKIVVVGRNPSLHPGDLRLLKPVYVPGLAHLEDVLVFPANGDRPHPNEMSGGDLDGDIYFVIWDEELVPQFDTPPMSFDDGAKQPKLSQEPSGVSITEIEDFFVDYIRSDNVGMIANSHLAFADINSGGASCNECIALAKLHSLAVDFAKTGVPATFPSELRAKKVPHFMSNSSKPTYTSTKILGKLYDMCSESMAHGKAESYSSSYSKIIPDPTLLVEGFAEYIESAHYNLIDYNWKLWNILHQYGVFNESEVWSGHVLMFSRKVCPKGSKDRDSIQKKLNYAAKSLWMSYRELFWSEVEDELRDLNIEEAELEYPDNQHDGTKGVYLATDDDDVDALRLTLARRRASAWYYCTYQQSFMDGIPPLVSFAWIMFDVLFNITNTK